MGAGNTRVAQAAYNRHKRRTLDQTIGGTKGYIDTGAHDVKIVDVELGNYDKDSSVTLVLESITGATHKERLWTLDRNDSDMYSTAFTKLINALFCDIDIYEPIDKLLMDVNVQSAMFKTFKGMRLRIELDRTPGFTIENKDGRYFVVDAIDNSRILPTAFKTISEARAAAVSKNLKRSWTRIASYEALSDDILSENKQHFDFAVSGIQQAKQSFGSARTIFNTAAFGSAPKGE